MPDHHPLRLGDATLGGPWGATTGLLVGSIFYDNHSLITDSRSGEFDQARAARLLAAVNHQQARYGVQMALDVLAPSAPAMERYLEFVAARTNLPLFINATEPEVRLAGLAAASRLGLLGRTAYCSLTEETEGEELAALGRTPPAAVMILACDIGDLTPAGTVAMVERVFQPMLREIGQKMPIVDVGTMDPPSVGLNLRQIVAVRQELGYPAGCAFANCFPQWSGLRDLGREARNLSLAAALVACRGAGAEYLHYGIIEKAAPAAHAAATAEVFYGFAAQELDGAKLPAGHPLSKMFKLTPEEA
ncbi:MAG: tetrahydromethanopterin S-methyltransferase subunit H [Deltaproteobacteria bacterium]|nr:tetrahydromethanopterin S-methyltransferase subunit H [Deltaproteobacteria bacterium]